MNVIIHVCKFSESISETQAAVESDNLQKVAEKSVREIRAGKCFEFLLPVSRQIEGLFFFHAQNKHKIWWQSYLAFSWICAIAETTMIVILEFRCTK